MCRPRREPSDQRCWEKSHMFNRVNHKGHEGSRRIVLSRTNHLGVPSCPLWLKVFSLLLCVSLLSCAKRPDANTLVMIIESSPTNLDPRVGTDAQSERIDELIFDPLVHRDEHFNMVPWVAEKWEIPDPQDLHFSSSPGNSFSRWPAADLARREVDAGQRSRRISDDPERQRLTN